MPTRHTDSFEVTTPIGHVVAVRGMPVTLGCSFTPDLTSGLEGLVITWQRAEDSRVVHSFYYNLNQLDRQSHEYKGRTALDLSLLQEGNASLSLSGIGPGDTGSYLCSVSNRKGTDKAQTQLEYAAFYSEPRLSIEVNRTTASIVYESEGYPEAEVRWKDSAGQELPHQTEFSPQDEGLFSLKARATVTLEYNTNTHVNLTFTLTNRPVRQALERAVTFNHGSCSVDVPQYVTVIVSVVSTVLFVGILVLIFQKRGLFCSHYK